MLIYYSRKTCITAAGAEAGFASAGFDAAAAGAAAGFAAAAAAAAGVAKRTSGGTAAGQYQYMKRSILVYEPVDGPGASSTHVEGKRR